MALASGARLGPYEVVESIGEGGMGQVYRARDTKLNRDVALKVLLDSVITDPDRLARFQREAELLASLNHPNIAQIYGLEDSGETTALVLELIEGPTLADRIRQGAMPLDEAIPIAKQIATALEAAHEQGIIHRDLKPANIKVTPDGTVKVLDFGLAKALDETTGTDPSESPTIATAVTGMGVIMGTAAYMSPEQARGKPVDRRADIWAFGVVLYEMLTGKRVFEAEDVSLTLAEVMKSEPKWDPLPPEVSPVLRAYLERCLEKDPVERVRDIGDVRLALHGAFDVEVPGTPDVTPRRSRVSLAWIGATAVIATMAAFAAWQQKPAEPKRVVRLFQDLERGQQLTPGASNLSLSPDGNRLAYSVTGPDVRFFIRNLDETSARVLHGFDEGARFAYPEFSPDGQWVAFPVSSESKLKKLAVVGGAPITLADVGAGFRGMDWTEDGTIVYAERDGLFRVSANGGVPERVSELGLHHPRVLPGARTLLVAVPGSAGEAPHIALLSLASGELEELFEGDKAYYVSTGHIVFARESVLLAVPFDASTLEVTGGAVALLEGVGTGESGVAQFALSDGGTLVYADGAAEPGDELRVLGLASLAGDEVEMLEVPPDEYSSPRLSADGSRLVVQTRGDEGNDTLWVYDLSGTRALQQLTFEGSNARAVWTPDGERITFASDREGTTSLYWKPADGSGVAERLTIAEDGTDHLPSSWSPDGKRLAFMVRHHLSGDWDVWMLDLEGEVTRLYDDPDRFHMAPEFSPDGNWLAYHSGDILSDQHVYVEPFPPTGAKQRISPDRAFFPMWSRDGTRLFFRPVSGLRQVALRSVGLSLTPDFGFSYERALALPRFIVVGTQRDYEIAPGGDKVLMVFPANGETEAPPARLQIVVNWTEELKARVPVN